MCCYKPGETSRLIYRPRRHREHKGRGRDTFTSSDYRDLVVRAHIQLQAPIVLIWDNLNTHRAAGMREYAAVHEWLTIIQLPSYAPDLTRSRASGRCYGVGRWPLPPSPTMNTSNALSAGACATSNSAPT
ncbi:transposase [Streptomyces sp. NPDC053069]|uniref:transposase n=1 Tax=Streptomyces sp. NPDC053069 TaxID=3365695 RepID=UPI0037CFAAD6